MDTFELIAQIISIFAMAMNILAYQQKTRMRILLFQMLGPTLFFISFIMLGGIIGAIMNLMAALRAFIYMNGKRLRADSIWWLYAFCALYVISYISVFTVFNKEPTPANLIIEFLPIIGMVATSIAYLMKGARIIRILGLVNSPCWVVYNAFCFSIGGILCDSFCIVSIIIGLIRLDSNQKSNTPANPPEENENSADEIEARA